MYDFLREFIILFFFSQIFSIIFIFLQSITFNAKRIIAKVNMIDLAVSGSIFFSKVSPNCNRMKPQRFFNNFIQMTALKKLLIGDFLTW